jgi:hypothetical protein
MSTERTIQIGMFPFSVVVAREVNISFMMLWSDGLFCENWRSESRSVLGFPQTFVCACIYCWILMKFGIRDLHVMPFEVQEFAENCHSEDHAYLVVVTLNLLLCRETTAVGKQRTLW